MTGFNELPENLDVIINLAIQKVGQCICSDRNHHMNQHLLASNLKVIQISHNLNYLILIYNITTISQKKNR